jgi:hypothetical protein
MGLSTPLHATPEGFAEIPGAIARHVRAGERVLLVLLDAFGMRFVERHADHPLLRALDAIDPLASQFPSTTTAHVTTLHTGLPVGVHGLYEWNVLEPSLGRVITPLRSAFAGDREADTLLAAGFDVAGLLPSGSSFYQRLGAAAGAPAHVFQPATFSPSTFDRAAVRGAELRPYAELQQAVADAVAFLASVEAGGAYAYVYFDGIDTAGHLHGPSSEAFDATALGALDAVHAGLADAAGLTVLMTADHGQVDVDPDALIWLDDLHPPLRDLPLRPAGSARDVFLHVAPEDVDGTVAALRAHDLEVHPTAGLLDAGAFGPDAGDRLRARLGSVCVLPPPDRLAWLRGARDFQCGFRGHHGGRTPEETRTWLGTWVR